MTVNVQIEDNSPPEPAYCSGSLWKHENGDLYVLVSTFYHPQQPINNRNMPPMTAGKYGWLMVHLGEYGSSRPKTNMTNGYGLYDTPELAMQSNFKPFYGTVTITSKM